MANSSGGLWYFTNDDSLLDAETYEKINAAITEIVCPILSIVGIFGNITNIVVFTKIGLKDSVTISFCILAMSDLALITIDTFIVICDLLQASDSGLELIVRFNIRQIRAAVSKYEDIFWDFSVLATTYIAVTRCCCVAMALKFKNTFTVSRTLWFMMITFILNVAQKVPIVYGGVRWMTSSRTNITYLLMWSLDHKDAIDLMYDIFNQNILGYVPMTINILCVSILAHKLKLASSTRYMMTSQPSRRTISRIVVEAGTNNYNTDRHGGARVINTTSSAPKNDQNNGASQVTTKPSATLSRRDVQIIKTTVLVCGIFVIYMAFFAAQGLLRLIAPEFDNSGRQFRVYRLLTSVGYVITFINAGINFFIYLNCNTRYRQVFVTAFIPRHCFTRRGSPSAYFE